MFLTQKDEQDFINFVKQAKAAMAGSSDENKFSKIVNLIENNEINKAVEAVQKLDPVTELVPFYKSKEFERLSEEQQRQFRDSVDLANGVKQATEGVEDKKEEEKPEPEKEDIEAPAEKETVSLDEVPGNEDVPELDKLLADSDGLNEEASVFDYLNKKADAVPEAEASIQTRPADDKILQVIKASVEYGKDNGMPDDEIIIMAANDAGMDPQDENTRNLIKDQITKYSAKIAPHTIEDKTAKVASFIDQINNYKPEPNKYEQVLKIAQASENSKDFLEKIAKELDENTADTYKGKEMFNGEHVTFGGGKTPKHPGQKAFMTRDGGNPAVESVFPMTAKPEVDVYSDKKGRSKVTSIKSRDGIIAFIQPIPFDQPEPIATQFNYNGVVGGEVQRTKEDVGDPKGVAGHKTTNYLDTINELADKDPEKIAGKLPKSKASAEEHIVKEAGFEFHASVKKKSNDELAFGGVSDLGNDAAITDSVGVNKAHNKKLTPEELANAKKRYEEHEAHIERASEFVFNVKAADESLFNYAISMLESLKEFPAAYNAVKEAAETEDPETFTTVLKRALTTNIRGGNENLDLVIADLPFDRIRAEYFHVNPEDTMELPDEPKGSEKAKEDKSDSDADIDNLLSGEEK